MEFRDRGAVGALLDEYEKAVRELQETIKPISQDALIKVMDTQTSDDDCRSIQTILSHVVHSGYGYAVYIRNDQGESINFKEKEVRNTAEAYIQDLNLMFTYNEKLFEEYPDLQIEENDCSEKILVSWGNKYDVEQIMEHAIVHVLRHRRQIQRFLQKQT